jgi:hypothetical protein
MFLGLLVTYFFIPDVKDSKGDVKSLEALAADLFEPTETPNREGTTTDTTNDNRVVYV